MDIVKVIVKVKVGQVWTDGCGRRFKIARIDDTGDSLLAWGNWFNGFIWGSEVRFGTLDADGTNSRWDKSWHVEQTKADDEVEETAISSPDMPTDLFKCFKAVPKDHCPCNIPRHQCTYHS